MLAFGTLFSLLVSLFQTWYVGVDLILKPVPYLVGTLGACSFLEGKVQWIWGRGEARERDWEEGRETAVMY